MINKYDPYALKDPYDYNMFRSLEIWWLNSQDMINKSGVIIDACWFWMILPGISIIPSHPNMIHDQGIINKYDQYHPLSHPVEIIKYQLPLFLIGQQISSIMQAARGHVQRYPLQVDTPVSGNFTGSFGLCSDGCINTMAMLCR